MALNPRSKGRRGEYEVAKLMGGKRQPLSGALEGTSDIIPPELFKDWIIEVKRRAKLPNLLTAALAQAEAAKGKAIGDMRKPMVAYREDHGRWMVSMYLDDFVPWVQGLAETGNGYAAKRIIRALRSQLGELEAVL